MDILRVLYIDDESLSCKYFKKIMGKSFYVTTADSLSDARYILSNEEPYDVIISDYRFDNDDTCENGLEFLKKYKNDESKYMLAICSAYDAIEMSLTETCIRFIPKPINYAKLSEDIKAHKRKLLR